MPNETNDKSKNTGNTTGSRSKNSSVHSSAGNSSAQRNTGQGQTFEKIMTLEQATRKNESQSHQDEIFQKDQQTMQQSDRNHQQTPQQLAIKRQSQQQRQKVLREMISGKPSTSQNRQRTEDFNQSPDAQALFYQEQAARIQAKKEQAVKQQAAASARQAYQNQERIRAQAKKEQETTGRSNRQQLRTQQIRSRQAAPNGISRNGERRIPAEPASTDARSKPSNSDPNIGEITYRNALKERQRLGKERRARKFAILMSLGLVLCSVHFLKPDFYPTLFEQVSDKVTTQVTALVDELQKDSGESKEENPASDTPLSPPPQEAVVSLYFSPSQLHSPHVYLLDRYDKNPLMQIGSDARVSPASLTKIMTALVAIERVSDLQQIMTVPSDVFPYLYSAHASVAGFSPNEQVPAIDLLYGCALPSGADAALALAVGISGSEADFTALMNEKAASLGMTNTNFANVSGLYHPDNYSTARDMAILLDYALDNETFRRVFSAKQYTTSPTPQHPEGLTFGSTVFGRMASPYFSGGEILGGKTGYIDDAGMCLASFAVRKNREFVLVTMGAPGDPYQEPLHLSDAFTVYGSLVDKGSEAPNPDSEQTE